MNYKKFITYNIIGGVLWVTLFTFAGYFFGNMEFIKENFHYAVIFIIVISILPIVYEYIQHKKNPDVPSVPTKQLHEITNS